MGHYNDLFKLDAKVFRRSNDAMAKALSGGKHLTRAELSDAIEQRGVPVTSSDKLTRLVMRAELDAVICSGPRRGQAAHVRAVRRTGRPRRRRSRATKPARSSGAPLFRDARSGDVARLRVVVRPDRRRREASRRDAGQELTRAMHDGADHWFVDRPVPRASGVGVAAAELRRVLHRRTRIAAPSRDGSGTPNAVIGGDGGVTHVIFVNGELVGRWKRVAREGRHRRRSSSLEARSRPPSESGSTAAVRKLERFSRAPVTIAAPRVTTHARRVLTRGT